jgi:hypothetical protein
MLTALRLVSQLTVGMLGSGVWGVHGLGSSNEGPSQGRVLHMDFQVVVVGGVGRRTISLVLARICSVLS